MASIRKAKKMGTYKAPSYDKKLYNAVVKQIEKTNKRLRNLERGGNYNSYASKKLFTRLDAKAMDVLQKTRKGKIVKSVKLRKGLSNTQLKAIQKATQQFLQSQTSTSRGIENVREQTKKSMFETLRLDPDSKITMDDIDDYYDMLGDKDFDFFNEKIGASAMWDMVADAKEMDASPDGFLKIIERHGMSVDEDVRAKALRLYDKYVI